MSVGCVIVNLLTFWREFIFISYLIHFILPFDIGSLFGSLLFGSLLFGSLLFGSFVGYLVVILVSCGDIGGL